MARRRNLVQSEFGYEHEKVSASVLSYVNPVFRHQMKGNSIYELQYTGTSGGDIIFAFGIPTRVLPIPADNMNGYRADIIAIFLLWELYRNHYNFFKSLRHSTDSTLDLHTAQYNSGTERISISGKVQIDNPKLLPYLLPSAGQLLKIFKSAHARAEKFAVFANYEHIKDREILEYGLAMFIGVNRLPYEIMEHLTPRILDTLAIKISRATSDTVRDYNYRRSSTSSSTTYTTTFYTTAEVTGDDENDQYIA